MYGPRQRLLLCKCVVAMLVATRDHNPGMDTNGIGATMHIHAKQASRQSGRQSGRQAGRQASEQANVTYSTMLLEGVYIYNAYRRYKRYKIREAHRRVGRGMHLLMMLARALAHHQPEECLRIAEI